MQTPFSSIKPKPFVGTDPSAADTSRGLRLEDSATAPILETATLVPPLKKRARTKTRQHVNALLQQDWNDINTELDKAVQEVRDLLDAKSDIEMIARVSGVVLV